MGGGLGTDRGALSSDESGWMFSEERGGTVWIQLEVGVKTATWMAAGAQ